ncbi:MAG: ribulokinase [Gemmatimonadetes bacterium]|nr:ribulokinase [Gemmatimonadota bacterium]
MSIVAGVDFGTLSVRVSIVDSVRGRLGSAAAEYPLVRRKDDPDHATQSHDEHMRALVEATHKALDQAGVSGQEVEAIAVDTTGTTMVPVDGDLQPLDDYYLWCDHRAKREATEITAVGRSEGLEALQWCGGVYSSEWGYSKLLHWLRHNPERRGRLAGVVEHCDMVTALLCGITDPARVPRSVCAIGHKWLWNPELGGLPSEALLGRVDPLLAGAHELLRGHCGTSDELAGHLCPEWAAKLRLRAGIPIPIAAFDAHWDAIGAGVREGDVVNVVGTSTCIMAIARDTGCIPGVCGIVKGSIHPDYYGIEAGLSATGDIFEAIARRAGSTVAELSRGLEGYRPAQTGLLRLTWDNGDRTVLVNPALGGVTFGWNLNHTAQDELFAAIEGTAFHTRIILERLAEYGVPIRRVINGGGVPQKNDTLNRVYANVLGMPVLVPQSEVTSLGSAIFAFLAAGTFGTVEEAQEALCPQYRTVAPDPLAHDVYEQLYPLFRKLYFGFGDPAAAATAAADVLPTLRRLAAEARVE